MSIDNKEKENKSLKLLRTQNFNGLAFDIAKPAEEMDVAELLIASVLGKKVKEDTYYSEPSRV